MNLQLDINMNLINPGLYIVSTPIGNLGDMTIRAIETLKKSDLIVCEDTRISKKLLSKFKINKKLLSNHKFSEKKNINKIINYLDSKKIVSLISDAGTPCISDPGRILVQECIKKNINIYPIPGPSAVSAAVSISGFSDQYYFHGFLEKNYNLNKDIKILSNLNCTIVFFISSRKINKTVDLLKRYFKKRDIVICKEISKFYEEYFRSSIEDLKIFKEELKGEITVVISEKYKETVSKNNLTESDKRKIGKLINKLSIKDISEIFSDEKNLSKKEVYNYCLYLKNEN